MSAPNTFAKKEGRESSNPDLPAPPLLLIFVDPSAELYLGNDYYLWTSDTLDGVCAARLASKGPVVNLRHFCGRLDDRPVH